MATASNSEQLKLDDLDWFIKLGGLVGFRLIVNLSAYGGIATERGLGLSEESLETVHLEEDIVKIFAASTLLMAAIARQPIDWS